MLWRLLLLIAFFHLGCVASWSQPAKESMTVATVLTALLLSGLSLVLQTTGLLVNPVQFKFSETKNRIVSKVRDQETQ